jgi:pentatricopeptide repeat protein
MIPLAKYNDGSSMQKLFHTIIEHLHQLMQQSQPSHNDDFTMVTADIAASVNVVWNAALRVVVQLWPKHAYDFYQHHQMSMLNHENGRGDDRSIAILLAALSVEQWEIAETLFRDLLHMTNKTKQQEGTWPHHHQPSPNFFEHDFLDDDDNEIAVMAVDIDHNNNNNTRSCSDTIHFAFNNLLRVHPDYMELLHSASSSAAIVTTADDDEDDPTPPPHDDDVAATTKNAATAAVVASPSLTTMLSKMNMRIVPNQYMYKTVLTRLLADQRLEDAIRLVQRVIVESDNNNHNQMDLPYILNGLITALAKTDPAQAETFLLSANYTNPVAINTIMDAYVELGELNRAKRLLHDDPYAYTILMKGYAKAIMPYAKHNECLELLQQMRDRHIAASSVTYATVLTSISKQRGDPHEAEKLFQQCLVETNEPPTAILYSCLIAIWSSYTQDLVQADIKASMYYDLWRGQHLRDPVNMPPPDPISIAKLIKLKCKVPHSTKSAHRFLYQLEPTNRTLAQYHLVLNAWKQEQDIATTTDDTVRNLTRMRELLDDMKTIPHCHPKGNTYLIYLKALAAAGQGSVARQVLEHEITAIESPDAYAYGAVMAAYGQSNDPVQAHQWYERMKQQGVKPHLYTYGVMLKAWWSSKLPETVERAETIYRDLQADPDHQVGVWHTNALLNIYANFGRVDQARQCLEAIRKDMVPQRVHYNTVLKAYAAYPCFHQIHPNKGSGHIIDLVTEATELVHSMRAQSQRPDAYTFTTLLQIMKQNNIPYGEARRLVEGMLQLAAAGESSAAPTAQTWLALLQYWRRSPRDDDDDQEEDHPVTATTTADDDDPTTTTALSPPSQQIPPATELDWIERMCTRKQGVVLQRIERLRAAATHTGRGSGGA